MKAHLDLDEEQMKVAAEEERKRRRAYTPRLPIPLCTPLASASPQRTLCPAEPH